MKTNSPELFSIENTPFLSSSIDRLLDESGFTLVGSATSVRQALGMLARHAPDVVIIDIHLPDMCGLDAIPLVLQQAPRAKIILLTDHNDARYQQAATENGAQACLKKTRIGSDLVPLLKQIMETPVRVDLHTCPD